MKLTYNGVELQILLTNQLDRVGVYSDDGQTYLYTRWLIDVYAIMNPKATAYVSYGDGTPVAVPGTPIGITDPAIRHPLMVQRKPLKLEIESGEVLLLSPETQDTACDVKGGPFPRAFKMLKINGVKTGTVRFVVETYTVECPTTSNVCLSHRWTMTETFDDSYKATRLVRGVARLRMDFLVSGSTGATDFPDQYRAEFNHPLPPGWKRENIQVAPDTDAMTIRYSFVDRQKSYYTAQQARVTNIEAFHTSGVTTQEGIKKGISTLGHGLGAILGGGKSPWAIAGNAVASVFGSYLSDSPSFYEHLNCKVWGSPETPRRDLIGVAIAVCQIKLNYRIQPLTAAGISPATVQRLTRSLTEKFVEYDILMEVPPVTAKIAKTTADVWVDQSDLGDESLQGKELFAGFAGGLTFLAPFIKAAPLAEGPVPATAADPAASWYIPSSIGGQLRDIGTALVLIQQTLESPCDQPPGVPPAAVIGGVRPSGGTYENLRFDGEEA